MSYELVLNLTGAHLEIEFDDLDELEQKLSGLDLARLERLVESARGARRGMRKKPAKKAAPKKAATKKAPAKKAATKKAAKKSGA